MKYGVYFVCQLKECFILYLYHSVVYWEICNRDSNHESHAIIWVPSSYEQHHYPDNDNMHCPKQTLPPSSAGPSANWDNFIVANALASHIAILTTLMIRTLANEHSLSSLRDDLSNLNCLLYQNKEQSPHKGLWISIQLQSGHGLITSYIHMLSANSGHQPSLFWPLASVCPHYWFRTIKTCNYTDDKQHL